MKKNLSLLTGLVAALLLPAVYLTIISLLNTFAYAVSEFGKAWYWISALSVGFGIQIGLFSFIRHAAKAKTAALTAEVTASGGISTVAMIACCAHYVAAVLPFIGFSAAGLFLAKYQVSFFIIGIFSNLVGIMIMLIHIQKHQLHSQGGFFINRIAGVRLKPSFYGLLGLAMIVSLSSFALSNNEEADAAEPESAEKGASVDAYSATGKSASNASSTSNTLMLESKADDRNSINIKVSADNFRFDKPLEFSISFNTHVGDMGFDVSQIAYLVDSNGNSYKPLRWEGDPPGGHHRSGKLIFAPLRGDTDGLKLVMQDVYDIDERVFQWNIQR